MFKPLYFRGKLYKYYEINEDGEIRNIYTDKCLKPWIINSGYKIVNLYDSDSPNQMHRALVHRLVAENFIHEIPEKMTVNHIDGNKLNNNVNNLVIVTFTQNIHHAINNGLMPSGEDNYNSKYTNDQIISVCDLLCSGKFSMSKISAMTDVDIHTISEIYARRKWKQISKRYYFPEILPRGGDIKKESFNLYTRLIIYKLWELGYTNREIACILHRPKVHRFYSALWDLKRSKKYKLETEKFNDYPIGLISMKRSEDLSIVKEAKKKGPYKLNKRSRA